MYLANRSQISAVALTEFGRTPRIMSRVRTGIPIYALSRRTRARARMSLMKDVFPVPFQIEHMHTSRALLSVLLHIY